MTLGEHIQSLRKQAGYSQEALGEALGVTRQSISKWESDQTIPEVEKLIALSRLFQVPVGVLLQVEESSGPSPEGELPGRDAAEVPKRKLWPAALAAGIAALALAFVQVSGLYRQMARLDGVVSALSQEVQRQEQALSELSRQVNSPGQGGVSSFTVALDEVDYRAGEALFSLSAAPSSPQEGLRVRFDARSPEGFGDRMVQGKMDASGAYSASLTCPVADDITFYVYFFGEGQVETQSLNSFSYLLSDSRAWANVRLRMDGAQADADGSFRWEGSMDLELHTAQIQDKSGPLTVDLTGLELRFYQNGRPVWGPERIALSQAGADGRLEVPLSLALELKDGDRLHLAGYSTDTLGRTWLEVLDWYRVKEDGGALRLIAMDQSPPPVQLEDGQAYGGALPDSWVNPQPG